MKNKLFLALTITLFLASCSAPKENNNDETSIHARADSAVGARMPEINQRAMDDLEQRMAIEVKAKADSIIAVRKGGLPKTTAKDAPVARPNIPVPDAKMIRHHDTARR